MRWLRQVAALLLAPLVCAAAYGIALGWDGEYEVIDSLGSWFGLAFVTVGMLGVSRVASHIGWRRRMVAAFVLATVFYSVRWINRPAGFTSFDESPEVVAWAVSIAVFMPIVVLAAMIEDTWRDRRAAELRQALSEPS